MVSRSSRRPSTRAPDRPDPTLATDSEFARSPKSVEQCCSSRGRASPAAPARRIVTYRGLFDGGAHADGS